MLAVKQAISPSPQLSWGALGGTALWQHQEADNARAQARSSRQTTNGIAAVPAAPDGGTRAAVLLRGAVYGASGMGVTVEPDGGSKVPTSAPVALPSFPTRE